MNAGANMHREQRGDGAATEKRVKLWRHARQAAAVPCGRKYEFLHVSVNVVPVLNDLASGGLLSKIIVQPSGEFRAGTVS